MLLSMMSTMRAKQSACFLLNAPFHSSDSFIFLSPWNTNILYRHKEWCGVCRNGRMANIVDIIEAAPLFVWAFVELGLFKIISLSNRNKVECSARTPLRIQGYSCIHVCSWVLKALFSPFLRRFGARSYAKTDDFRLRKNFEATFSQKQVDTRDVKNSSPQVPGHTGMKYVCVTEAREASIGSKTSNAKKGGISYGLGSESKGSKTVIQP
jgi:hypothetical protein